MKQSVHYLISILLCLMISAGAVFAHDETESVTIRFDAVVGELPVACGMTYNGLGTESSAIGVNDFRFFVSNVRLITPTGREEPVTLTQDGMWQYDNVALLDFEDGTGGCGESGNPELNTRIIGEVHEGTYTGIAFDLGIPFDLNHLDTTTAPAPLNVPAMWWNWLYGYKFARVDLVVPGAELPSWFIHLGSTGCESADGNTPPESACSNTNVASVYLDNFEASQSFIVADLAQLLAEVNLTENTPQPPGCMSGTDDADCEGIFAGFGIDLASGVTTDETVQRFFQVKGAPFEVAEMSGGMSDSESHGH